ncbi:hypothetical protein HYFRA_00003074 [Hymenoscyphus fraxineus]|uniref:NB-ARC domain-containing protein n=1 Tax=Hymenoscyphus fraxineus TaxID=746836 RepID=A0A9N9PQV4_9HELO|nr:hypothetical protein HYFRA_00003074 [Hymenoscyphus fraxineus]
MPTRLLFKDYQVAWIAPLPVEQQAALYMLDKIHRGNFEYDSGDDAKFIGGEINGHNIIVATLPPGTQYGGNSAASLATQIRKCMGSNLWFGLLVGIAAGLPNLSSTPPKDIRLGDVLVSLDEVGAPGVVQHDMGKETPHGFENTSHQTKSLSILRSTIGNFQALGPFEEHTFLEHLERLPNANDPRALFSYQDIGQGNDLLYASAEEGEDVVVQRDHRPDDMRTQVWYGTIGSGNTLMKFSHRRDELRDRYKLIGMEMEAHGILNTIPVGHIRGVCDYADDHKNDEWHGFAAATAAAYAREVLCSINPRNDLKVVSLIPFPRNKRFVGREEKLREIEKRLASQDSCERLALYGLGGCGKTAIALEFAYRTQEKQPKCSIFWVAAITKESFEKGYLEIGTRLRIPGISDPTADVKQLVQDKLSDPKSGEWLLIIDNADDVEVLYKRSTEGIEKKRLVDYLPPSSSGSILFTTRTRKAAVDEAPEHVLDLQEMGHDEAREMLFATLLDKSAMESEQDVTELLKLLTFLPLAIIQAASYLNKNGVSISDYIALYQGSESEIIKVLEKDFEDLRRYSDPKKTKNPIATTWVISFDQIRKEDEKAAQYLSFMSCLLRENIPTSLLPRRSRDEFLSSTGTLKAYSFITERKEKDSFDIHRLVYIATRNWLKQEKDNQLRHWTNVALSRMKDVLIPNDDLKDLELWRAYLPHANQLTASPEISSKSDLRLKLLYSIGQCQIEVGQYRSAQTTFQDLYEISKRLYGNENQFTSDVMSELARSYSKDGKFTKAGNLWLEVLEFQKRSLGDSHIKTIRTMVDFASVLFMQGDYTKADAKMLQAMELSMRTLGEEHPSTLLNMDRLATSLQNQGKYAEAERSYRELLISSTRLLGEDHPDTISVGQRLGVCLMNQNKLTESEEFLQNVVGLRKKTFGKEHPRTLKVNNKFIELQIRKGGDMAIWGTMCRENLTSSENLLGEHHDITVGSMQNIAFVHKKQVRYEHAARMFQKIRVLRENVHGREHPNTLSAMYDLAECLTKMGNAEGDSLHVETLALKERAQGPTHTNTLFSVSAVAKIRERERRYDEASALYQRAYEGHKSTFGEQHSFTEDALRYYEGFLDRWDLAERRAIQSSK